MNFGNEIDAFIKGFVKDLHENSAAIFAGAGMSKAAGFVDWPELLRDIAQEIGLKVEQESDLITLAQFHVNARKGSAGLAKKIVEEFSDQAESSEIHDILARLPISTYWTTNYDTLIEDALTRAYKIAETKHSVDQLTNNRPKRDAVVYKMHGDVTLPTKAVLYKEQYERYYQSHAPFVTALSGDLVSKTFLFVGFSFTDPNLDYVLSRLHVDSAVRRNHYCFMRKETQQVGDDADILKYKLRKQELRIDDLRRFGIQTILIEEYFQIPEILKEIESRYRKKTIFISGSAAEYGTWLQNDALNFVHSLSLNLVKNDFRIVNGFGWGIGSAVINGALEAIYGNPKKFSEDQLIMRPFPQHGENIVQLWEEYRKRMISLSGIAIFIFGNKIEDGKTIHANGVRREFEIAREQGVVPIPIGLTGYVAEELHNEIIKSPADFYGENYKEIIPLLKVLNTPKTTTSAIVKNVLEIVKILNR